MRKRSLLIVIASIAMMGSISTYAEDHEHMDHQKHLTSMNGDQRQVVDFPPVIRVHFLSNMRGHLQALSDITGAMGIGEYEKARSIAEKELGMNSISAAGCKMDNSFETQGSGYETPEQLMNSLMPPLMKSAGVEMHQAASDFAAEVSKVSYTGDTKPALSALSRLTQRCISCHASFRVQ